jgi:hypothetical protein
MKLCKDCKFFNQELVTYGDCNHESNMKMNYVTGVMIARMYAQGSRELDSMCGPDGKYFEEAQK